jgi:hypothetical protein
MPLRDQLGTVPPVTVEYSWRGSFENHGVNRLHAEGFDHAILDDDWLG